MTVWSSCMAAAGVDLPVLADLGSSAVLRFSELFAGDEVDADPPVAKAGKQRQPRSAEVPGTRSTSLSPCFCVVCGDLGVADTARTKCHSCMDAACRPWQRGGCPVHAEEGAPGEDEEALLHGEDVEALEAEAWASEPDEDGEAGRAEGGESGR